MSGEAKPEGKKSQQPAEAKMKKGERHPPSVIMTAMQILVGNDYNYLQTEKDTKINRKTLAKWAGMYNIDSIKAGQLVEVTPKTDEDIQVKKDRVLKTALNVKEELIKKIGFKLRTTSDIDKLSRALKVIHEVTEAPLSGYENSDATQSNNNLIQYITQMIILQNDTHGTKGN